MKKIRLFFHKHRTLTCIIILNIFIFYLSYAIYQKEDLWNFEKTIKNALASISDVITPKINVNYQSVVDTFTKEKEEELDSLRKLLDLTTTSSFDLIHTSIIQRNATYYFDEITIDKGKEDGIDQGMLAICEKGLVGVVKNVTKNSSTVKLLTEEEANYKIAVAVYYKENKYNGVITGYDLEKSEIIVTSIRSQSNIEVGSIVKTNQLGGVYPENIMVGTVSEITYDDVGISKILKIKSEVDFENLKYVSIIKGAKS